MTPATPAFAEFAFFGRQVGLLAEVAGHHRIGGERRVEQAG
jgi:hypothetical protein